MVSSMTTMTLSPNMPRLRMGFCAPLSVQVEYAVADHGLSQTQSDALLSFWTGMGCAFGAGMGITRATAYSLSRKGLIVTCYRTLLSGKRMAWGCSPYLMTPDSWERATMAQAGIA